jgi:hypothetical protein
LLSTYIPFNRNPTSRERRCPHRRPYRYGWREGGKSGPVIHLRTKEFGANLEGPHFLEWSSA